MVDYAALAPEAPSRRQLQILHGIERRAVHHGEHGDPAQQAGVFTAVGRSVQDRQHVEEQVRGIEASTAESCLLFITVNRCSSLVLKVFFTGDEQ